MNVRLCPVLSHGDVERGRGRVMYTQWVVGCGAHLGRETDNRQAVRLFCAEKRGNGRRVSETRGGEGHESIRKRSSVGVSERARHGARLNMLNFASLHGCRYPLSRVACACTLLELCVPRNLIF